jgi:hypothetical protein
MKTRIYIYLTAAILIAMCSINSYAQSRSQQELRFEVPFAFNVGETHFSAGQYRACIINPTSDRSLLRISSSTGKTKAMVLTIDVVGRASLKAKLSFRHYGNQYFLVQVWMAGDSTGLAIPTSSREKALRQQLGSKTRSYDVVAVNGF